MDSNQIDKYNMLLKVDDFFDDHTAETSSLTVIDPKHDELEAVIDNIQLAAGDAMADHTGVTEDKAAVRLSLEQQAFTALTAVSNYARDINNRKLLKRVNFTLSALEGMRDETLHFQASVILSMVTTHSAMLGPYGYTPAQQAAFALTVPAFLEQVPEPKDAIEERAVANEQVGLLLQQADGILESLDGYMDTFRFSNTELYSEYKMARGIDNSGGGSGGGDAEEYTATGSLAPLQTTTALVYVYNPDLAYTLSNTGPGMQMEATILLNGVPVPGVPPILVNVGTPLNEKLSTWSTTGNQLQLRNTSPTMSLTYTVSLTEE